MDMRGARDMDMGGARDLDKGGDARNMDKGWGC